MDVYTDGRAFRHRLTHDELALTHGQQVGSNRLARLCREKEIASVNVKQPGPGKTPGLVAHDDHTHHRCTPNQADRAGLTDMTEHRTCKSNLFVWAMKDSRSNRRRPGGHFLNG